MFDIAGASSAAIAGADASSAARAGAGASSGVNSGAGNTGHIIFAAICCVCTSLSNIVY